MVTKRFGGSSSLEFQENYSNDSLKWSRFGREVLPLWVADMDLKSAPAIQEAVKSRAAAGAYGYVLPSKDLLSAIVRNGREAWGATDFSEKWIRFHPGLIGGLYQACRLGDSVIVPTPVYPPFLNAARDS